MFHTWRELRSLTRDDDDEVVEEEALLENDEDQDSGVEMNWQYILLAFAMKWIDLQQLLIVYSYWT